MVCVMGGRIKEVLITPKQYRRERPSKTRRYSDAKDADHVRGLSFASVLNGAVWLFSRLLSDPASRLFIPLPFYFLIRVGFFLSAVHEKSFKIESVMNPGFFWRRPLEEIKPVFFILSVLVLLNRLLGNPIERCGYQLLAFLQHQLFATLPDASKEPVCTLLGPPEDEFSVQKVSGADRRRYRRLARLQASETYDTDNSASINTCDSARAFVTHNPPTVKRRALFKNSYSDSSSGSESDFGSPVTLSWPKSQLFGGASFDADSLPSGVHLCGSSLGARHIFVDESLLEIKQADSDELKLLLKNVNDPMGTFFCKHLHGDKVKGVFEIGRGRTNTRLLGVNVADTGEPQLIAFFMVDTHPVTDSAKLLARRRHADMGGLRAQVNLIVNSRQTPVNVRGL